MPNKRSRAVARRILEAFALNGGHLGRAIDEVCGLGTWRRIVAHVHARERAAAALESITPGKRD